MALNEKLFAANN